MSATKSPPQSAEALYRNVLTLICRWKGCEDTTCNVKRAALDLGLNRGLQRAAEIARAHPTEKPHHRYSHWVAIHGGELRELIAAAIDREREETR